MKMSKTKKIVSAVSAAASLCVAFAESAAAQSLPTATVNSYAEVPARVNVKTAQSVSASGNIDMGTILKKDKDSVGRAYLKPGNPKLVYDNPQQFADSMTNGQFANFTFTGAPNSEVNYTVEISGAIASQFADGIGTDHQARVEYQCGGMAPGSEAQGIGFFTLDASGSMSCVTGLSLEVAGLAEGETRGTVSYHIDSY